MTLCTPSPITKPIPLCTQYLEIGTISTLSHSVNAYIHDITTDRIDFISGTSDGAGLITLDLTDFGAQSSHSYEFWVTLQGANSEDKEDITIDTTVADTFALRFRDISSPGDTVEAIFTTQTLELA